MEHFKEKNKALNNILKETCESYIFIDHKGAHTSVGLHGNTPDLLVMMRHAYQAVCESLEEEHGKKCAEALMKTITMTEEEMDSEIERMKKKISEETERIPKWLRKLMELEKDEDNEDPDKDKCETETEEESDDEGCDADLNVRVDLHHHRDDDNRK